MRFGHDERVLSLAKEWPKQRVSVDGKSIEVDAKPGGYLLGDHDLPVAKYRAEQERIFHELHDRRYPVVFFEAATGGGKTSNTPLAALETNLFDVTYVAEPRIVLAREARKRLVTLAAEAYGQERAEQLIGFATSAESELHPDNRVVVGTHGYISGAISHQRNAGLQNSLLIVDEFHDREKEGDTVLEVAKALDVPAVVMSATIDTESLSQHHCRYDGTPAPVLRMEGRQYSIEELSMPDATQAAIWSMNQKKDTLYLLPRVEDIELEASRISGKVKVPHVILPFHGQQSAIMQNRALRQYDVTKLIIATGKIAGTGLTTGVDTVIIPDVSRTETLGRGGVPSLVLQRPPDSEVVQAMGRVSRDRPGGIAIRAPYHLTPKNLPPNHSTYDKPEIMRTRVDGLILRLGTAGLRLGNMQDFTTQVAKKLDYKDLPSDKEVERSVTRLRRLGAISIDNMFTNIAYEMATLPVDPQLARMIVASRDYPDDVRRYMIAAACVAQFNGVVAIGQEATGNGLSKERRADMLRDLDVYLQSLDMGADEQASHGILPQRIDRIIAHITEVCGREGVDDVEDSRLPTEEEREQLLACMATGIEELFIKKGKDQYRDPRDRRIGRRLPAESPLRRGLARVAGTPWNLETMSRGGRLARRYFIIRGMQVDMERLPSLVPERCGYEERDYEVASDGTIVAHHEVFFDGQPTGYRVAKPIEKVSEGLRGFVVRGLFQEELKNEELLPDAARRFREEVKALKLLEHRSSYDIGSDYLLEEMQKEMERDMPVEAGSVEELLGSVDYHHLRSFISNKERQKIIESSPRRIAVSGKDGTKMQIGVTYKDHAAIINVPNFTTLRELPSFIPELDGRRVLIRIGSDEKTLDYYQAKEKYQLSRSARRNNTRKKTIRY